MRWRTARPNRLSSWSQLHGRPRVDPVAGGARNPESHPTLVRGYDHQRSLHPDGRTLRQGQEEVPHASRPRRPRLDGGRRGRRGQGWRERDHHSSEVRRARHLRLRLCSPTPPESSSMARHAWSSTRLPTRFSRSCSVETSRLRLGVGGSEPEQDEHPGDQVAECGCQDHEQSGVRGFVPAQRLSNGRHDVRELDEWWRRLFRRFRRPVCQRGRRGHRRRQLGKELCQTKVAWSLCQDLYGLGLDHSKHPGCPMVFQRSLRSTSSTQRQNDALLYHSQMISILIPSLSNM